MNSYIIISFMIETYHIYLCELTHNYGIILYAIHYTIRLIASINTSIFLPEYALTI